MASKHNKSGTKCYHWRKNGHVKRNCRLLDRVTKEMNWKENFSKNMMKSERDSSNSENKHYVGLFALLTNKEIGNWIVDSGATCYVCYDVKNF